MNDEGRRLRGLGRRSAPTPDGRGSGPRPNELSGAAVPNVLEGQTRPSGAEPAVATRPAPASGVRPASPASAAGTGVAGSDGGARRSIRPRLSVLANVPTLVFLGFLALTAVRMLGEMVEQGQPASPVSSAPAAAAAGPVAFGTAAGEDCELVGAAVEFAEGEDVWWSAKLSKLQPADADALVITKRNGAVIARERVPAEPELGRWDALCSSAPVERNLAGRYRVEVWNGAMTELLAAGDYVLS
jgi:hypothetical protein